MELSENPRISNSKRLSTLKCLNRIQAIRSQIAESCRMYKSSWMKDPTRSREILSFSAINLALIRRSSKVNSLFNLINNAWGVQRFVSSRTRHNTGGKIPSLTWATQILKVPYADAYSLHASNRMAWNSFSNQHYKKTMRAPVYMFFKLCASPEMFLSTSETRRFFQFVTWTDISF